MKTSPFQAKKHEKSFHKLLRPFLIQEVMDDELDEIYFTSGSFFVQRSNIQFPFGATRKLISRQGAFQTHVIM